MNRAKKWGIWFAATCGALLAVLCVLALILVRMADQDMVLRHVKGAVSRAVDGDVTFDKMAFSLFPYPRVAFDRCRLNLPGKTTVTIRSLSIRPEILPLLMGRFAFAEVTIGTPDVQITLTGNGKTPGLRTAPVSLKDMAAQIADRLGPALALTPGLTLKITSGRLSILNRAGTLHYLADISGRVKILDGRMAVDLSCTADLWARLSLKMQIDTKKFTSKGRVAVKGVPPQTLFGLLWPKGRVALSAPPLDLAVAFDTQGLDAFRAKVDATVHTLQIQRGGNVCDLQVNRLAGAVFLDRTRSVFTLAELDLGQPRLRVSGKLETGPIHLWPDAPTRLNVNLTDAAVAPIREAVLSVAGDAPVVGPLFNVVRGGRVPEFTLSARADSPGALWKKGNLFMTGHLDDGKIHVPGADLDLTAVQADVVISDRILEGTNIGAQLGPTAGSNGKLMLVFEKKLLYQVDIDVAADLAQLPPILKRLVGNPVFTGEVDRLTDVRGDAIGRLALKGGLGTALTQVAVSDFTLSAEYQRLPHTIDIRGSGFSYDPTGVSVTSASGRMGRTTFSDLSGSVNWEDLPAIAISSGRATVDAAQIHPWLQSYAALDTYRRHIGDLGGYLSLSDLQLSGPLFAPGRWQIQTRGAVDSLAILFNDVKAPTVFRDGTFHFARDPSGSVMTVNSIRETLMGTTLKVSGTLHNLLTRLDKADVRFDGDAHPEFLQWLYGILHLPRALHLRSPLSITDSRMIWTKNGSTAFKGKFQIQDGPGMALDVVMSPDILTVQDIQVQDGDSTASLSLTKKENTYGAAFSGRLACSTLNALFVDYPPGDGWIEGDIRVDAVMGPPPWHIAATGKLKGERVHCSIELPLGLKIESIALSAKDSVLHVENAVLDWEDTLVSIKGKVAHSTPDVVLDLTMVSGDLSWDRLSTLVSRTAGNSERGGAGFLTGRDLRGKLRVTTDNFTIKGFTWHPFEAEVLFLDTGVDVDVVQARLCGIDTPGLLQFGDGNIHLDVRPSAVDQPLEPMVACLRKHETIATGTYNLSGNVTASARRDTLIENLGGNLSLHAENGRVYRNLPLAKLFAFLNMTAFLKPVDTGLDHKGFAFRSIDFKGHLANGKLVITEGLIDSPIMEIACQGDINLMNQTLDLEVLAAPLQAANFLIKKVPVVNQIMGGTLVSIPAKIKGGWQNPVVSPLPPGELAEHGLVGLVELIKRAVQMPVKLITPFLPKKESIDPQETKP